MAKTKDKEIAYLNFQRKNEPEVMAIANNLAKVETKHTGISVKPHNAIKRLIIECGAKRIEELTQSAKAG